MRPLERLARLELACRSCPGLNLPGITEAAPGCGRVDSPVMLLGQSNHAWNSDTPDRQVPFRNTDEIQHAGSILFPAIEAAGFGYEDLFTTNVVHCHPPRNRACKPAEIKACRRWLLAEIALVRPRLIVCLGAVAGEAMDIPSRYSISRRAAKLEDGTQFQYWGTLMPHPAYLLRMQDSEPDRYAVEVDKFRSYLAWVLKEFMQEDK